MACLFGVLVSFVSTQQPVRVCISPTEEMHVGRCGSYARPLSGAVAALMPVAYCMSFSPTLDACPAENSVHGHFGFFWV